MKQDKETRNKLLQSARAEFLEKGYMKASLRTICKNAGVTTGALYFFFQDKEDLFESIAKETINNIWQMMQGHYNDERVMAENGMTTEEIQDNHGDLDESAAIIQQMYLHRDDILLVLTKAQGTKFENIADKFIETSEVHYRAMAAQMQKLYPGKSVDDQMLHWLAHMQIDAFIYMITHIEKEEEGLAFMRQFITYMITGWVGLWTDKN